jgi:hypothetical protein
VYAQNSVDVGDETFLVDREVFDPSALFCSPGPAVSSRELDLPYMKKMVISIQAGVDESSTMAAVMFAQTKNEYNKYVKMVNGRKVVDFALLAGSKTPLKGRFEVFRGQHRLAALNEICRTGQFEQGEMPDRYHFVCQLYIVPAVSKAQLEVAQNVFLDVGFVDNCAHAFTLQLSFADSINFAHNIWNRPLPEERRSELAWKLFLKKYPRANAKTNDGAMCTQYQWRNTHGMKMRIAKLQGPEWDVVKKVLFGQVSLNKGTFKVPTSDTNFATYMGLPSGCRLKLLQKVVDEGISMVTFSKNCKVEQTLCALKQQLMRRVAEKQKRKAAFWDTWELFCTEHPAVKDQEDALKDVQAEVSMRQVSVSKINKYDIPASARASLDEIVDLIIKNKVFTVLSEFGQSFGQGPKEVGEVSAFERKYKNVTVSIRTGDLVRLEEIVPYDELSKIGEQLSLNLVKV